MFSWLRYSGRIRKPNLFLFFMGKIKCISFLFLSLCLLYTFYALATASVADSGRRTELAEQVAAAANKNLRSQLKQKQLVRAKLTSSNVHQVQYVKHISDEGNQEQPDLDGVPDIPARKVLSAENRRNMPKHINGEPYPKLAYNGKFVPIRRWVHLDLKGGPYKPAYFMQLLPFFKSLGINGILLEWEDMFPYSGKLASAANGDAYTLEQVDRILESAKAQDFEIVPLVQTFGHLEWILKLEPFAHLREDHRFPQVICLGSAQAWELLTEIISQVGRVHRKYGLNFFHMGADEVFQLGVCNDTIREIEKQGSRDRTILFHISRVATYIKSNYGVTVMAWHDMFSHVTEQELLDYNMTQVVEPVLWSYAEDLDQYLPYSTWLSLKPFKKVWGSAAFKGADGPMRFSSNPIHYIRNHESWINQMNRVYREFDYFQGLILAGWSRYDHLAILCELLPVGIPSLAMSLETIMEAKPLKGVYTKTYELLDCQVPSEAGYVFGCKFPGHRIYELINEYENQRTQIQRHTSFDYEFNGWLSEIAEKYKFSSAMYIEKISPFLDYYLAPLERLERDLRSEMAKHFFLEAIDEFILTYMHKDLKLLRDRKRAAEEIAERKYFQKRPYVKYASEANREL